MIINNAKIEDLKQGDIITLEGIEILYDGTGFGTVKVKSNTGFGYIEKSILEQVNIIIYRQTPEEQALVDVQRALNKLNSLGGIQYELKETPPIAKIKNPKQVEIDSHELETEE